MPSRAISDGQEFPWRELQRDLRGEAGVIDVNIGDYRQRFEHDWGEL